ncbi:glycoside hydrolase family 32 protein [Anoxybacillus flavithermus]|uniref:glycoside hydrolase family 32 protein n=1 Tax=Anoxybacillus flavithermus TaxID=33934 RepID=UPI0030B88837
MNSYTGYVVGTLDYETGKLAHGAFEELDKGFDFYAAQTFEDEKGRRILFGWMDMWESFMPTQAHGWAGALTIPRLLELADDEKLLMKPVPELQLLREGHVRMESISIREGTYTLPVKDDRLELLVRFSLTDFRGNAFGVKVRCSSDGSEETIFRYDVKDSIVTFDRNRSGKGEGGIRRAVLDKQEDVVTFHVFIDRSSVELFVNGGRLVMTGRIYPSETSQGIKLFAEGGILTVLSVEAWTLQDIWGEE